MEVQVERSWSHETLSYNTKSTLLSYDIHKNKKNKTETCSYLKKLLCFIYLSPASFFAGGGLLFFESVDSRLNMKTFSVNISS